MFWFAGAFGRANVGFGCYPVLKCFDLSADCAESYVISAIVTLTVTIID